MKKHLLTLFIFTLLSGLSLSVAHASVGKVIIAKGETYALDPANNARPLKRRSEVMEGDTLVTGPDSEVHIRFEDNAVLALRADSQLKISEYHSAETGGEEKVLMELLAGGFRTITGTFGKSDKDAYQIRTPNASIGIRGTNYEALLNRGNLLVGVYQGGVRLENQRGTLNLGSDSAFSFAQVGGMNMSIEGLVEPPGELKTPLATSFNSPSEPNDESDDEATANLQSEDEDLLIENLFAEQDDSNSDREDITTTESPTSALAGVEPVNEIDSAVNTLTSTTDLSDFADVRLTQEQIQSLRDGTAKAGFVVVNEDPSGYRIANYSLTPTTFSTVNTVSFDVSIGSIKYTVNVPANYSLSNPLLFAADLQGWLTTAAGTVNSSQIPSIITAEQNSSTTEIKGFLSEGGAGIVFDNFTGDQSDVINVLTGMGLCTTQTICAQSFSDSALTINEYHPATHFGYMVKGSNGPVFVNWESETLSIIGDTYRAPDHVFRGNANAALTNFDPVDIRGDGTNAIEWGYWNTSADAAAVLLKDPTDLAIAESVQAPYFFITAPPAKQADLVGSKTFSTLVDWHATSSTSTGMLDSSSAVLTASLDVNFSNQDAVGSLNLAASDDSWGWNMKYVGNIEGAQFFSDYGYGSLDLNSGSTNLDAVGHVDGLFTAAQGAGALGFAGGFNLQTTDDSHQAQGIFILK